MTISKRNDSANSSDGRPPPDEMRRIEFFFLAVLAVSVIGLCVFASRADIPAFSGQIDHQSCSEI
jgi:hypothetical protein